MGVDVEIIFFYSNPLIPKFYSFFKKKWEG